jgi:predicted nucleic acid-binding protein
VGLRENAFLERCDDYDKGAVDTLLAGRSGKPKADHGEAEAVVQAAHAGAVTIVDDPWGRSLAQSYDLEFHGTLWVLRRLWELQLRSASALREDVIKLRRRGTRFPETDVNDLLKEMGQAPLGDAD